MAMQGTLLEFLTGWLMIPWRILEEIYMFCYPPLSHDETDHITPSAEDDKTIDQRELKHWTNLAERWWDPEGDLALLRGFNSCRIPMIVKTYRERLAERKNDSTQPLQGARIIDVGCGAGFVAEPLAELGADVTAVDMVPEIIRVAETHWTDTHGDARGPEYLCTSVEKLAVERTEQYDMLLCLEVLDHVGNMPEFVKQCCKLVRPGGCAIFSTFNQTVPALLLGVIGAEHLLRVVPMNTHHFYRFIKPSKLEEILRTEGLRTVKVSGCFPVNPFARRPKWMDIPYCGVTYAMVAVKD